MTDHTATLRAIDEIVGNELTLDEAATTLIRGLLFAALSASHRTPQTAQNQPGVGQDTPGAQGDAEGRTWSAGDPEPTDVATVWDKDGDMWSRNSTGWQLDEMVEVGVEISRTWEHLTQRYAPVRNQPDADALAAAVREAESTWTGADAPNTAQDSPNLLPTEEVAPIGSTPRTGEPEPDDCPHCDPRHGDPNVKPWSVYVGPERDGDGQPMYLHVQPSDGAHVAESDATWLWELLQGRHRPHGEPTREAHGA